MTDASKSEVRKCKYCGCWDERVISLGGMYLHQYAEHCLDALKSDLATLTRQRDGLREAIPFPDLSANSADAIAYELECEHPKYTTTKEAKAVWLRDIAKQLRAFEAARKETNDR